MIITGSCSYLLCTCGLLSRDRVCQQQVGECVLPEKIPNSKLLLCLGRIDFCKSGEINLLPFLDKIKCCKWISLWVPNLCAKESCKQGWSTYSALESFQVGFRIFASRSRGPLLLLSFSYLQDPWLFIQLRNPIYYQRAEAIQEIFGPYFSLHLIDSKAGSLSLGCCNFLITVYIGSKYFLPQRMATSLICVVPRIFIFFFFGLSAQAFSLLIIHKSRDSIEEISTISHSVPLFNPCMFLF